MRRAALLALTLLALLAPAAGAQEPRASLPDIEDEVMCLECGVPLNVSTSKVADQQREFIADLIAQGKTKPEIKAALVAEYGPRVLGEPEDDGFALTAWLIPIALGLAGIVLVGLTALRWRRTRPAAEPGAAAGAGLDPTDARRLDAELAAFDRR